MAVSAEIEVYMMDNTEKTPFRQQTIDAFLEELGSGEPTPGGGAAAGLLGGQACALAEMSCRLTISNADYEAIHEKAKVWLSIFQDGRSIMLDLMDEDAANFGAFMKLLHQPKPKDPEDHSREEALQAALEKCTEAPMQIGQTLSDMMNVFTTVLQEGNKNLVTDSVIAIQCAIAAIRASILNVRINLKYIKNEFFVREAEDTIRKWEDAVSAADAVLTYQVTL